MSIVPTKVPVVDIEATTLKSGLFEGSCTHFICKTVYILLVKLKTLILQIVLGVLQNVILVIYQTREAVFPQDIQTPRKELKMRRAVEYF